MWVELLFSINVVLNLVHFQMSAESLKDLWKDIKKLSDIIVIRFNNSNVGNFFNHGGFFQLLVQSAVTRPECMLQGDFPWHVSLGMLYLH